MTEHSLTYRGVKVPAHIVDSMCEAQAFADWSCGVDDALDNGPGSSSMIQREEEQQGLEIGDRVRVTAASPTAGVNEGYSGEEGSLEEIDHDDLVLPYRVHTDSMFASIWVHAVEVIEEGHQDD